MFTAVEKLANKSLRRFALPKINAAIAQYGQVKSLVVKDKKIKIVFTLAGIEDRDINVTCSHIQFNDECTQMTIGRYSSDVKFIETALNTFATRPYPLKPKAQVAAKAFTFIFA